MTDRALESPRASTFCELALCFGKHTKKRTNGIRNKAETYPINRATVCPHAQQALKAKRVEMMSCGVVEETSRHFYTWT